ncbi:MAG: gluconate kinase, partial [Mucispirillum sp.]|nr:gluconate kinase [Mucispirillum sp.]
MEKELNERFSKGVYLEVLKIVRTSASDFALVPVENSLAAVEYVLKMKRIKDEDFLQNRIDNNKISCEDMEKIGRETALLLKDLEPAPKDEKFENVFEAVKFNAVENFNQTEKYVKNFINEDSFNYIQTQTLNFLNNNKDLFNKRSSDGFVKNGHGDLRLEHIYFNDDGSVGLIDCIE